MNLIYRDEELQKMMNEAQLRALERVRTYALAMRCRTRNDSIAMTAANMLPLFIKERGMVWAKREVERILVLLVGATTDKRAVRRATKHLHDLL